MIICTGNTSKSDESYFDFFFPVDIKMQIEPRNKYVFIDVCLSDEIWEFLARLQTILPAKFFQ